MRYLLMLGIFAVYLSNAADAQQAPIRFGLWEGTIVNRSTVNPYTASIIRQKGQTVPTSFSQSYRVCMNQVKWEQEKAAISVPPRGCLVLHNESTPKEMSLSVKCKLEDGTSVLIGAKIAWMFGTKTDTTIKVDTI